MFVFHVLISFRFLENQIRGLDEEETDFLDYVSDRQRDIQKAKMAEDEAVLNEYRVSFACHVQNYHELELLIQYNILLN